MTIQDTFYVSLTFEKKTIIKPLGSVYSHFPLI